MAILTIPKPRRLPRHSKKAYTPDEFLGMEDAVAWEMLDDGTLQERNMGWREDRVVYRVGSSLGSFVDPRELGAVIGQGTGLQIFADRPSRIPRPDVAFLSNATLAKASASGGHLRVPPDLIVEVVSPGDTVAEVEAKVAEYLAAGVLVVWVVKPHSRSVEVWRSDGSFARLTGDDQITAEELLPGFSVPVSSFFPV